MSRDRALDGQVAVVTGGGSGIGKAIVFELCGRGARVLLTGRHERRLAETVGEIAHGGGQARHLAGDVRDASHVRAAVQRALDVWGRVDIAVANAGVTDTVKMGETVDTDAPDRLSRIRAVVDTNLLGTIHLFDAAAAAMKGPGRLVAISSILGKLGVAGQSAYCASKAATHGLVRALAVELGARGIACNAVCPGWVDTDMARDRIGRMAADAGEPYERMQRRARENVPAGRFVEAEEVARLVAFLCSPDGSAITGQALSICGGATPFAG